MLLSKIKPTLTARSALRHIVKNLSFYHKDNDGSKLRHLCLQLHAMIDEETVSVSPKTNGVKCAELVPSCWKKQLLEHEAQNFPVFEHTEESTPINSLCFKICRSIAGLSSWIVPGQIPEFDRLQLTFVPFYGDSYIMLMFSRPEYHKHFLAKFCAEEFAAANSKSAAYQKPLRPARKVEVLQPSGLVKRRENVPVRYSEDLSQALSWTVEMEGHTLASLMPFVVEQGCVSVIVDHGSLHAVKLNTSEMEDLLDIGHGLSVEQAAFNGVIGDETFYTFPFMVITTRKSPTSPKTALKFIKTPIGGTTKTYLAFFTAFEWATLNISRSKQNTDLAIARLTGEEILKIAYALPVLDGGLIMNFGIVEESCLAKNIVITKEEIKKFAMKNNV